MLPTISRQVIRSVAAVLSSVDRLLPREAWHLKGSAALLGYLGPSARLPNDIDLSLSTSAGQILLSAAELPAGFQGERLHLLDSEPVVFSSPGRATVFRALVGVQAGEEFGKALLNVLLVSDAEAARDTRVTPMEFSYDGFAAITVPTATFSRCLAQKLLRYTRKRGGGKINTRWTDLTDFLLAAASPEAPPLFLDELRRDVAVEFIAMGRDWPTELPSPPLEWLDFWDTATFRDGLEFGRLPEAAERLARFWEPVLETPVAPYGRSTTSEQMGPSLVWSSKSWKWTAQ
ncbi:nucleotidyl transferase AbiEii/AbiGii toxin family protein [Streptomyces cucumeris]|uniref:nucleotidyl transferase AbiEii/AbiGii toxin family protein n=1 Tax=Streptomyces cucumeris TaxID=2962890 RepID=UPI003EBDDFF4